MQKITIPIREVGEDVDVPVARVIRERSAFWLGQDGSQMSVPYHTECWAADLTQHQTFSGIPQSSGMIMLETNPALSPFRARGYGWNPGWYHEARNTAQVEGAMEEMVSAVEGTPLRLTFDETPPWLEEYEPDFRRQREWARRVWHLWNQPSNDWARLFAQQSMRATPWYGFFLGEVVAKPQWWQLDGEVLPRRYYVPTLPKWIAPWSVHRWVTHGDRLVGVALQTSQEIDYFGNTGEAYCILPAEKFLHCAARPMGPNWEGRSHLRSGYNLIRMVRETQQVEALGHEVHGIGLTVVEEPPKGWTEPQRQEIDNHFLNAKSSHVSYLRVPPGGKVSVLSPQSQLKELGGAIGRLNQAILMGLGAEGKLIGMKAGSNAARSSASEDAWRPFSSIAHNYVIQPLNRLFARVLRYSFPECRHFCEPRIQIGAVEKKSASDIIQGLSTAKQAGLLENDYTRSIIGDALGIDLSELGSFGPSGTGEGAGL